MSEAKHTPTPWKVVSVPNFDNGLVYTSIQPVTVDEEAMKPLAMANGEYHVCRMSHTAAEWRFNYHRADAAFIVEAVNSFQALKDENELLKKDRNIQKAHSALRGRILQEVRDKIGPLVMSLEDEGDRIYLGSTNDKDWLTEIEETIFEVDDEVWATLNQEEADPYQDLYDLRVNHIPALNADIAAKDERIKLLEQILDGGRPLPFDRDELGRTVREAWVRWAEQQPSPKASWLVPYESLPESDQEADRQIGEAIARWTLIGDSARTSLKDEIAADERIAELATALATGYWKAAVYHCPPPKSRRQHALSNAQFYYIDGTFKTEQEALAKANAVIAEGRPTISIFIDRDTAKPVISFHMPSEAMTDLGRLVAASALRDTGGGHNG